MKELSQKLSDLSKQLEGIDIESSSIIAKVAEGVGSGYYTPFSEYSTPEGVANVDRILFLHSDEMVNHLEDLANKVRPYIIEYGVEKGIEIFKQKKGKILTKNEIDYLTKRFAVKNILFKDIENLDRYYNKDYSIQLKDLLSVFSFEDNNTLTKILNEKGLDDAIDFVKKAVEQDLYDKDILTRFEILKKNIERDFKQLSMKTADNVHRYLFAKYDFDVGDRVRHIRQHREGIIVAIESHVYCKVLFDDTSSIEEVDKDQLQLIQKGTETDKQYASHLDRYYNTAKDIAIKILLPEVESFVNIADKIQKKGYSSLSNKVIEVTNDIINFFNNSNQLIHTARQLDKQCKINNNNISSALCLLIKVYNRLRSGNLYFANKVLDIAYEFAKELFSDQENKDAKNNFQKKVFILKKLIKNINKDSDILDTVYRFSEFLGYRLLSAEGNRSIGCRL